MPSRASFFELKKKNMKQIDKGIEHKIWAKRNNDWRRTQHTRIPNTDRVPCAYSYIWRACANVPCNDNELNEFSAWYFSLIIYSAAAFRFNHSITFEIIWNEFFGSFFVFRFSFCTQKQDNSRISNAWCSIFCLYMNESVGSKC